MADTNVSNSVPEKGETRAEMEDKPELSKFWLGELAAAEKRDRDWIKRAKKVVMRYRDERDYDSRDYDNNSNEKRANILWSNTELLKSALFQGLGNPDVRRRFPKRGKDEKNTKQAALVMERGASYVNDSYNCEAQIEAAVEDMVLPGRGVVWVVYDAVIRPDPETGEDAIMSQSVRDEHVYWEDYRTSGGRKESDIWWKARCHYYSRDDLKQYFPKDWDKVPLNSQLADTVHDRKRDEDDTFKRAKTWEIWDKSQRQRVWVAEDYKLILKKEDDPYRLENFFPCPEALYGVKTTSSLVPVPEFTLYQDQATELDQIATRLCALVEALKRRGVYDASIEGPDNQLSQLAFAKDNEFVPYKGFAALAEKGGLKNVFQTEDLAPIVTAIEGLYKRATFLIQQIYEITGISDIMRGASAASETATAQSIKANFGSMRLQKRQKIVARFVRDLVRIKTEIIAEHWTREQLVEMTGLDMPLQAEKQAAMQQLAAFQAQAQMAQQMAAQAQQAQIQGPGGAVPSGAPPTPPTPPVGLGPAFNQPPPPDPQVIEQLQDMIKLPSWEEISAILRSDQRRGYKIDVETDETAQADEMAEKNARVEFMNTMIQQMQVALPAAIQLPPLRPLLKETTMFTVKAFKAGRPLEEAFDDAFSELEKMPPQSQPDPEQMKLQAQVQQNQAQLQFQREQAAQQVQIDQTKAAQDAQLKQQELEHDKQLRDAELAHQMQLESFKANSQIEIAERKQASEERMRERELANNMAIKDRELAHQKDMQHSEQEWQALLADDESGAPRKTGASVRPPTPPGGGPDRQTRFAKIIKELSEAMIPHVMAAHVQSTVDPLRQAIEKIAAERDAKAQKTKRIVRDERGKAIGVDDGEGFKRVVRDPQTGRAIGIEGQ